MPEGMEGVERRNAVWCRISARESPRGLQRVLLPVGGAGEATTGNRWVPAEPPHGAVAAPGPHEPRDGRLCGGAGLRQQALWEHLAPYGLAPQP
eukprot:453488-Alexandrium_andersonii.AAC.1